MSGPALLAAALLLAPAAGAPRESAPAPDGPRLVVEPERFDFGDALPGRSLSKEFSLRNVGSGELVIEKLATSCACTAFLLAGKHRRLAPGARAPLRVTLRTPATAGRVVEKVRISSNDPRQESIELEVAATVTAAR